MKTRGWTSKNRRSKQRILTEGTRRPRRLSSIGGVLPLPRKSLGLFPLEGQARARGERDEPAPIVRHPALNQPHRPALPDHLPPRDKASAPEWAEEVDLQLYGRERLVCAKEARVRHPHRRVGNVADDSSMERAHRVLVLPAGLELD